MVVAGGGGGEWQTGSPEVTVEAKGFISRGQNAVAVL